MFSDPLLYVAGTATHLQSSHSHPHKPQAVSILLVPVSLSIARCALQCSFLYLSHNVLIFMPNTERYLNEINFEVSRRKIL
ncbi:CLUMA_CG018591, isoform A [Clunio marinus]|uniref:CLUMA_CG018591, isoform A n=1 Tax=Clunio marinus TaxID=568069 RepID=A0A1J1IY13_9DIPT|nr:CLUMA_CG018591, isoform A [Clunio marinus]